MNLFSKLVEFEPVNVKMHFIHLRLHAPPSVMCDIIYCYSSLNSALNFRLLVLALYFSQCNYKAMPTIQTLSRLPRS